jgi:hypothetical protein
MSQRKFEPRFYTFERLSRVQRWSYTPGSSLISFSVPTYIRIYVGYEIISQLKRAIKKKTGVLETQIDHLDLPPCWLWLQTGGVFFYVRALVHI